MKILFEGCLGRVRWSWRSLGRAGAAAGAGRRTAAAAAATAAGGLRSRQPVDPLQPDFNLAALPTTLRMPKHKLAFRVTHRFTRSLGRGDFGDLLNDFFGFDSGAQIGLEFRYGLLPGTQIGVHRTSDRTIEIFGQQSVLQQKPDGHPLSLDVIATLEGPDNMRDQKSSAIGVLVSQQGRQASPRSTPSRCSSSTRNPVDDGSDVDNNTMMIGLGGRACASVRRSIWSARSRRA